MSETEKRNFYGDNGRPAVCEILETLLTLTGSEACARELVEAADYTERTCGPDAMLMPMPEWIQ
jgi:hypothetical protein